MAAKKVIVLGKGFIASHLPYNISNYRLSPDDKRIGDFLDQEKPDVIINTVGFVGTPNVDQCQVEKSETYIGNVVLPCLLASECERRSIHLINIGSGCIFYGPSPRAINHYQINCITGEKESGWITDTGWVEEDIANPISHYSKTKYACDLAISALKNVATLRIRMPISSKDTPRNLLNKLIGYKNVLEEPNSMTFMDDLVSAIDWTIDNEKTGIYHFASPKPITHSMLLNEYKKYQPTHEYRSIGTAELSTMTIAARSNCILDCRKITNEGFKFGDTDTRIHDTIKAFAENRNNYER